MSLRPVGPFLARASIALTGLLALGLPARGQLYTADPYDPYGRPYRAYTYPGGGEGFAPTPGTRVRGGISPNQFDRFEDDLGLGRGSRYDDSFRRFDSDFDRDYVPNQRADRKYIEDRERRERDMIAAMRERDPKKREAMIRDAERESREGAADPSLSVRRGTTRASIPAAPGRRATRPSSGSGAAGRAGSVPAAPTRRAAPATGRASQVPTAPGRPRTGTPAASTSGRAAVPPAPDRPSADDASDDRPSEVLRRAQGADRDRRPVGTTRRGSSATTPPPR